MPGSNYTYITTAATTVIGPATAAIGPRRINLISIAVNKILTGTVTIKSGATTIGVLAASAPIGNYWLKSSGGTEVADLQIVNGSTEDVTVFWDNL